MEKLQGSLEKTHGGQKADSIIEDSVLPPIFLNTSDHPVLPTTRERPFLDEEQLGEEVKNLLQNISNAGQAYADQSTSISSISVSGHDWKRWGSLEKTFDDVYTIQSIQREELRKVDQLGAESWFQTFLTHAINLGSEIVAKRNTQNLLELTKKYGLEDEKAPYLRLMDFYCSRIVSVKIGGIALRDFINPRTKSPVKHYRFLCQAFLIVHQSLYDEILQDNQEPPKNAYPNMIKAIAWVLPTNISSLLTTDPKILEEGYRKVKHPLNEIAIAAAQLIRGVQDIREKTFRLLLNPRSESFQDLRQVLQNYFSKGDRQTTIMALNLLGLSRIPNIQEAYRQSRKYESEGTEQDFFSQVRTLVFDYAKEAAGIVNILTIDDIPTVLDMDDISDHKLTIPSFDQLGKSVSGIFNLSSKRNYDIDPQNINWGNFSIPQKASIEFDQNRPRKFEVKLEYNAEEGEPDINYTLDTSKNTMDWELVEDPELPESDDVDYFRKNLLIITDPILQEVTRQAKEDYILKHQPKATEPARQTAKSKRERFEDPTYKLRRKVKIEERQKAISKPPEEEISIETLISNEGIKKQIVLAEGETVDDKFIGISPVDRERIKETIIEFNKRGVGDLRRKSTRPGSEPRYDIRVSCSTPKGARVLMRESNSGNGTRRFEIINITYRGRSWRINKLW